MTAPIEIRETIVTPTADGLGVSVELHISDAPKNDEFATFRLLLLATMPNLNGRPLEGWQIAAMERAWQELDTLQKALYQQVPAGAQQFLNPKE